MFQLEPHGPVVKLTLTHDELDEKDDKFFAGISGGWPEVLSNLKSLLEGGHAWFRSRVEPFPRLVNGYTL